MNATALPRLKSETIEEIMREHDALQRKVNRIHTVLSEPEPAPQEIDALLREFLTTLIVHFSNEEAEEQGFFAEVSAHSPSLAGSAAKLCVEHRQLLHDANELCQFASAGSPSIPWWRELRSRCHEFYKRLRNQEFQENKLLHEAYKSDNGACD